MTFDEIDKAISENAIRNARIFSIRMNAAAFKFPADKLEEMLSEVETSSQTMATGVDTSSRDEVIKKYFDTPKRRAALKKCEESGWLEKDTCKPNPDNIQTLAKMAAFAVAVAPKFGFNGREFAPWEKLWGISALRTQKDNGAKDVNFEFSLKNFCRSL